MGTWGFNILDDDTARDVYDDYLKGFNVGRAREAIMGELLEAWKSGLEDADDGPIFWIAVAKAQWDCGHLDAAVVERVRGIVERGEGLGRWEEQGAKVLARRREKLEKFLAAIREVNPKPRKPKKAIKRKPVFRTGDCVAVRLTDGDWGAVIVLAEPPKSEDPAEETYGENIVGVLRHKGKERPGPEVFEGRDWLWLNHHNWGKHSGDPRGELQVTAVNRQGFLAVKDRFEVVGRTEVRGTDPIKACGLSSWTFAEQVLLQERWDRGER